MIAENDLKTRYRSFIFTHNNYTDDDIEYLRSEIKSKCRYVIWGKELAPTTGTPHLQGFIVFATLKSYSQVLSLLSFPSNAVNYIKHVTVDNGCAKYSKKDDQWEEHGVRPLTTKRKARAAGAANLDRWENAKRLAKEGRFEELPADIYWKFYSTAKAIYADTVRIEPIDWTPGGSPYNAKYQWQIDLMDNLALNPHPREIIWIYDTVGNYGKSEMATYLACNYSAFVVDGGRNADLAHAYKKQNIIVFDFARTTDWDKVNYGVIEHFKNGRLFSPKYESKTLYFPKPHVIVFANSPCPSGKFSEDRIRSINLCPFPYAAGFIPPQVSIVAPVLDLSDWVPYSDLGIERLNSVERKEYLRNINY